MTNEERFYNNVKLVPFVYNKWFKHWGQEQRDLFQEGYLALWKACLLYDESQKKFTTYSVKAIKRAMTLYLRWLTKKTAQDVYEKDTAIFPLDVMSDESYDFEWLNVESYLTNIKPKHVEVYKLFCEGYTRNDIKDILGCSKQNVNKMFKSNAESLLKTLSDGWDSEIRCPLYQPGEHGPRMCGIVNACGNTVKWIQKARLKEYDKK